MRVVVDAVGLQEGGGAVVLRALLQELPRARPDWQWHVYVLDLGESFLESLGAGPGLTLETVRTGRSAIGRVLWSQLLLPRRARRLRADALLCLANVAPARPSMPQVVLCQTRKPFARELWSTSPILRRWRYRLLRGWILRSARASDAVIVQTESMGHTLIRAAPDVSGKCRVIPSGVAREAGGEVRPEVRERIESLPEPRLLYVSVPRAHKNHATLLRALPRVAERFPDVRLMLTVDEAAADPDSRAVAAEAERLGLSSRVAWLGRLGPAEVLYALESSRVVVFPSLTESFGLPLVESMSAGRPLAAADLDYAHDVAADAAVYFDPCDEEAIAEAILRLLSDPESWEELRARGLRRAELFAPEKAAEQVAETLEQAVHVSGGPSAG